MRLIYLDHAATTPVLPEVVDAMIPYWTEFYGNASSLHQAGRDARAALNTARDRIAAFIGCLPSELVFTGSGTESDNTALFGAAEASRDRGRHIITTQIEHHAVLHACQRLEKLGYDLTYLPADSYGRVSAEDVKRAVRPDTILISVMYANNEVGTLQPVEEIGQIARERKILFHVDAVQALGHVPIDLSSLPVDLMSFSAHKLNGPKGTGALYISRTARVAPLLYGGSQERKRRAGTENTAGIVGFGEAVNIFARRRYDLEPDLDKLHTTMIEELRRRIGVDSFRVNSHPDPECRLAHVLNVSFPGITSETMLMNLDLAGVAASSGSACTSGSLEVSHVLQAMGLPEEVSRSAVRFSFGAGSRLDEIVEAAEKIEGIVKRLRKPGS